MPSCKKERAGMYILMDMTLQETKEKIAKDDERSAKRGDAKRIRRERGKEEKMTRIDGKEEKKQRNHSYTALVKE